MENAVDALKMAAAVLVFILALSVSINAFGQARAASQTILDYNDREYDYTYVEADHSGSNFVTERTVGMETVIPTIYKSYLENYKVVFEGLDINSEYLYATKNGDGSIKDKYLTIDLANQVIGGTTTNDDPKLDFLSVLLYGKNSVTTDVYNQLSINFDFNISEYSDGIYGDFSNTSFTEKIGIYYQDDVNGIDPDTEIPEANKQLKKVITYSI